MPIDRERVAGGNVELDERELFDVRDLPSPTSLPAPIARIVKPAPGVWRYRSHHASCPDAWRWKRR